MAFVKATKKVEFAKIGFIGPTKAGKTTTAVELAIYIAKKYHPGKPVAVWPTEPGLDYCLEMFDKEKIPVLEPEVRSRSFARFKDEAIRDAIAVGAGVLLVDQLTHLREDLVADYKKKNSITRKLKPFEYTPINEKWAEWTFEMMAAPIDIIVLGRIGNIFEELEDEEGETELKTIGKKMKAGNETEYELDQVVEMSKYPDPDATANAVAVPKLGKPDADGSRRRVGTRMRRTFVKRYIHVATVTGGRVWALNGQAVEMKEEKAYKVGMCNVIGEFMEPYLTIVKSGPKGTQSQVTEAAAGAGEKSAFEGNGNGATNGSYFRKKEALETWEATVKVIFKDGTALCRQQKQFVCERITETRSMTAFAHQSLEDIKFQLLILQKLELRSKTEGIPEREDDLGALVDLAREEAEHEWGILHGQAQTATSEPAGDHAEIPF